eukprot:CAMPEP_0171454656 /NCGR_PEP_ID=MMETSP0945-20130129/1856_1 /TAXON_ID=109269 /ORGANISM="Vaucheria litorea, Strain CCMP2940" /LENGTH=235 /DNA_ID=CAMNT_0011979725 /DNA_START=87 /DNA_END=792 /DNA_ORIENTATION=-
MFDEGKLVLQTDTRAFGFEIKPVEIVFLRRGNSSLPFVESFGNKGKTRETTIVRALDLKAGQPFKVDLDGLRGIHRSNLFDYVGIVGGKQAKEEKAASLVLALAEKKSTVFEPGITKGLFDSQWAGEISFEERNLFGRNYLLGVDFLKEIDMKKESFKLRFGNNRFGRKGAWMTTFFRDPFKLKPSAEIINEKELRQYDAKLPKDVHNTASAAGGYDCRTREGFNVKFHWPFGNW